MEMKRIRWSLKKSLNRAKKCKTRTEFIKSNNSAYQWLLRNKSLEELNILFPKSIKDKKEINDEDDNGSTFYVLLQELGKVLKRRAFGT